MSALPYSLTLEEDAFTSNKFSEMPQDDLEAEFIRVFDGGPGGPPCPLYEGRYVSDRMLNMAELVRFYNHFGLSFEEGGVEGFEKELPDHLVTELEFLHYLTFKELIAIKQNQDPTPYRRAIYDFISRHMSMWLPKLIESLEYIWENHEKDLQKKFIEFYRELLRFTLEFVEAEQNYAHSQIV